MTVRRSPTWDDREATNNNQAGSETNTELTAAQVAFLSALTTLGVRLFTAAPGGEEFPVRRANQGDQQGRGSTGKATLAADVRVSFRARGRVRLGVGRSRVELSPYDALELAGRLELAALHAEQAGAA